MVESTFEPKITAQSVGQVIRAHLRVLKLTRKTVQGRVLDHCQSCRCWYSGCGSNRIYNICTVDNVAPVGGQMSEDSQIFVIKTTANQERSVATALARVSKKEKLDIRAILAPDELKGYVLVEAPKPGIIELAIQTIPHARALVKGSSSIAEIEHFLKPKPTVTGIKEGAIIEVTSGPFKGEKARVKRVDEGHEEITVELFDAVVPIPITIRGDTVRILKKEKE